GQYSGRAGWGLRGQGVEPPEPGGRVGQGHPPGDQLPGHQIPGGSPDEVMTDRGVGVQVIDRNVGVGRGPTGTDDENGTSHPRGTDDRERNTGGTHQSYLGWRTG